MEGREATAQFPNGNKMGFFFIFFFKERKDSKIILSKS